MTSTPLNKRTGLMVEIIGSDCTNYGVTSGGRSHCILVGDGINAPFSADPEKPLLTLVIDFEPRGCAAGYLMLAKPDFLKKIGKLPSREKPAGEPVRAHDFFPMDYVSEHRVCRVRAVPVAPDGSPRTGGMFGGHYITSSDSRFPISGPVPVFDRFE